MAGAIAILTPDPGSEAFHMRWPEVVTRMAEPLQRAGFAVDTRSWTDAGDLAGYRLVLPMTVWGYHQSGDRWGKAVDAWDRTGVRLRNPAPVLRWNADKRYLAALATRGAPVVPTLYLDRVSDALLADAAEQFGTDRLVAKPQVSAGAWQTIRWSAGTPLEAGPSGPAMVQPYLPAIEAGGEVSLFYFGGRFSHAVRKRPRSGDFRVQPEFDAEITAHSPSADEREAARAALAAVEEPLLYARVDLVRGPDDRPLLMELELVEPDLYLAFDPARGAGFAAAVIEEAAR